MGKNIVCEVCDPWACEYNSSGSSSHISHLWERPGKWQFSMATYELLVGCWS